MMALVLEVSLLVCLFVLLFSSRRLCSVFCSFSLLPFASVCDFTLYTTMWIFFLNNVGFIGFFRARDWCFFFLCAFLVFIFGIRFSYHGINLYNL